MAEVLDLEVPVRKGKKKGSSSSTALVPAADVPKKKKVKKPVVKSMRDVEVLTREVSLIPQTDPYDAELHRMFDKAVGLAARLEEQMEDRIFNRDVYALNTLYSQIREIVVDLRSSQDFGQQMDAIRSKVLEPYHNSVGQALMDMFFHLQSVLPRVVKDEYERAEMQKKIQESISDTANSIQGHFGDCLSRVADVYGS